MRLPESEQVFLTRNATYSEQSNLQMLLLVRMLGHGPSCRSGTPADFALNSLLTTNTALSQQDAGRMATTGIGSVKS
jgi:hypothetical protein